MIRDICKEALRIAREDYANSTGDGMFFPRAMSFLAAAANEWPVEAEDPASALWDLRRIEEVAQIAGEESDLSGYLEGVYGRAGDNIHERTSEHLIVMGILSPYINSVASLGS